MFRWVVVHRSSKDFIDFAKTISIADFHRKSSSSKLHTSSTVIASLREESEAWLGDRGKNRQELHNARIKDTKAMK